VCWEANLVYNDLYHSKISTSKYVPIVFTAVDAQHIPPVLQGRTHFCLDTDQGYWQLYRLLTGQPEVEPGALGPTKTLPPREPLRHHSWHYPVDVPADIAVVPKKLESFDEDDREFFLALLPGPYREDGLPESLFVWKRRIEQPDGDRTFRVGVMYGPSGCGKSSYVKAGMLPRLGDHVMSVHLEATRDGTEVELLSALRKRWPDLPPGLDLAETCVALRDGSLLAPGGKLLIVIDQFEQWLQGRSEEDYGALSAALQTCDGARLQCLLLIRDDFWTLLTRFLRHVQVRMEEGKNAVMVDLFDKRHAKKVLILFGRALDALPKRGGLNPDQESFLDAAVDELADGGRVVCVKLALFAEIVKGWNWHPDRLREAGGMKGVGALFLEDMLSGDHASPARRRHARAAEDCLKLLLPDSGSELKGKLRTRAELQRAAGYSDRPEEFAELLGILERELRLIKATVPDESPTGASETSSAEAQPLYRLTHDYLVPSIREWLAKLQRDRGKDWRGRAELRLEQLTAQWQVERDRRFLPGPVEFLTILLAVPWKRYRHEQSGLMRTASRWYGSFAALAVLVLAVVWLAVREGRGRAEAPDIVRRLIATSEYDRASEFREIIRSEAHRYRPWVRRGLEAKVKQQPEDEFRAAERVRLGKQRADAAIALWQLGNPVTDVLKVDKDPESLTQFVHRCKERGVQAVDLWEQLQNADHTTVRYGLLLALGEFDRSEIRTNVWVEQLAEWYANDPKSAIHSACGWLLRHWGETERVDEVDRTPLAYDPQREWFVVEVKYGEDDDAEKDYFTFIVFPPGKFMMGSPEHEADRQPHELLLYPVQIEHLFALCDREISNAQYRRFLDSTNKGEENDSRKPDHPRVGVSWYEAVAYCRWLKRFGVDFRLPSEQEWEYACRAGTITPFSHGSDETLLKYYARYGLRWTGEDVDTGTSGALRANRRGLFDIHGNVWEWCSDQFHELSISRVIRGGGWPGASQFCRSACRGALEPAARDGFVGFRVAAVPLGQAHPEPEHSGESPNP
jgi:formylglycine-generating enzyme required for sulfatase activity